MRLLPAAMLMALIGSWLAGCALKRRIVVISQDRLVLRLEAGQTLVATNNGWFIPDARMQELLHELNEKSPGPGTF